MFSFFIVNSINGVIANGVKQSHEIATLARQSASARRHVTSFLAMTTVSSHSQLFLLFNIFCKIAHSSLVAYFKFEIPACVRQAIIESR
jgi:hypothetical protein